MDALAYKRMVQNIGKVNRFYTCEGLQVKEGSFLNILDLWSAEFKTKARIGINTITVSVHLTYLLKKYSILMSMYSDNTEQMSQFAKFERK